jgi:ketosteroid isomerase-like protein
VADGGAARSAAVDPGAVADGTPAGYRAHVDARSGTPQPGHGVVSPRYRVVDRSGDLAYTVGFEEGEVRVDGGPPSPMTLRVTHVLRRIDRRSCRDLHLTARHPMGW